MMDHGPYISVTQQNMEFFLTVAKTLNMRKSASILNVTQPLLSQRIAQMENELQIKLFLRGKQGLSLTPAGESFARDCQQILSQLYAAVDQAQAVHQNRTSHITIGLYDALSDELQFNLSKELQSAFSDLLLDFRLVSLDSGIDDLHSNNIDLLLLPDYEHISENTDLQTQLICTRPICATMSVDHPLTQKESLLWADLNGIDILFNKKMESSGYEKEIRTNCLNHGFEPNLIPFANTKTLNLYMSLGRGIGLAMTAFGGDLGVLTSRYITDSSFSIILAWKTSTVFRDMSVFAEEAAPVIATVFES